MIIACILLVVLIAYCLSAWIIVDKYATTLFMCHPSELTKFGHLLRYYVIPFVWLWEKL